MTITQKPPKASEEKRFISGAPDGQRKGVIRGKREQITLTIAPGLLAEVDAIASRMGQSRAALINRWIYLGVRTDKE